jgi:hypothetical protein
VANDQSGGTLRRELERALQSGRCVYCRREAAPDQPLTHEHVIPRARGGTRRDVSIIVPACARCNQRRGCSELVRFLLLRPSRISAFLDYLATLSPDGLREMDDRVLAEVYAAVWMLRESRREGDAWRERLKRLCTGRTIHRRRYAARRVVGAVGGRLEMLRERVLSSNSAGVLREELRPAPESEAGGDPDMDRRDVTAMDERLIAIFALAWRVSAVAVREELERQQDRVLRGEIWSRGDATGELDGWRSVPRKRRLRVDRRRGRPARRQHRRSPPGGRGS